MVASFTVCTTILTVAFILGQLVVVRTTIAIWHLAFGIWRLAFGEILLLLEIRVRCNGYLEAR